MHPIEHLRYVARSHGSDPVEVALETASAFSSLVNDPAGLVVAARRVVEHHPTNAPLWWMCARVLTALDPRLELRLCVDALQNDATSTHIVDALPDDSTVCIVGWNGHVVDALTRRGDAFVLVIDSNGDGQHALRYFDRHDVAAELVAPEGAGAAAEYSDITIVSADACGRDSVLAPGGALAIASVAYCTQKPVWLVAGCGTRLADPLWDAVLAGARFRPDVWATGVDLVPLAVCSFVIGPDGMKPATSASLAPECQHAPELLRRSVY